MYLVYAVIAERYDYDGDRVQPLAVFGTRQEAIEFGQGYLFDDDADDRLDRRVGSQDSVRMIEFDGVFPEVDLREYADGRAGCAHGECVWRAEA